MKRLLKVAIATVALMANLAHASLFDGQFSQAQSFDVARSGCSVTGGSCTVSQMINPYIAPWSNRVTVTWAAGDYLQFYDTGAGGQYNIGLKQFRADGTFVTIVSSSGYVTAIGDGIVYIGQPTQMGGTGYFFSNSQGFAYNSSTTFTVVQANPTMSDLTNYAATTTPLAVGQTAASVSPPPAPAAPTVVSTAPGASSVTVTETPGATVTSTAITRGSTTSVTTLMDTRGDRGTKELIIVRTTTVTSATPVTTVVTNSTPVTITTDTTPSTVTTYSDNTTTTTIGATSTSTASRTDITTATTITTEVEVASSNQGYSTRIDQMDKLMQTNNNVNYGLVSDPLSRNLVKDDRISNRSWDDRDINVYVHGSKTKSNTYDGYNHNYTNDTIGVEHRINRSSLLGFQFNRVNLTLTGVDGGGNLQKEAFSAYGLYVKNDWLFKADIGSASNTYYTNHSLPELNMSNNAKTNGKDTWAQVRIYTPGLNGFRPFIGARTEKNMRDYVIENGSFLTAVDYAKLNQTVDTTDYGIRYDYQFNKKWAVAAEVAQNNKNLSTAYGTLMFNAENNSTMILKIGQMKQDGVVADVVQLQVALRF